MGVVEMSSKHSVKIVIAWVLSALSGFSYSQPSCQPANLALVSSELADTIKNSKYLKNLAETGQISSDLVGIVSDIVRLNWAENGQVKGEALNWPEFEKIEGLIQLVRSQPLLSDAKFWEPLIADLNIGSTISAQNKLMESFTVDGPWKATEYEMQLAYRRRIEELNNLLPPVMRKPSPRLGYSSRNKELLERANAIMHDLENKSDRSFSTSGYATPEMLKTALEQKGPDFREIADKIANGDLKMLIHRRENARSWIEKLRSFQNQHVVKRQKWDSIDERDSAEAFYQGKTKQEQTAEDPEVKPLYGYIEIAKEIPPMIKAFYGSDGYVLKKTAFDRISITVGDSLMNYKAIDPTQHKDIAASDKSETVPRPWHMLFVPWKNRILIAPYLAKRPDELGYSVVNQGNFIEWQLFGPLHLEDIQEFRFSGNPPEGYFLQALRESGLRIMDVRQGIEQMVEWQEPGK
jgi:hypothetical protein